MTSAHFFGALVGFGVATLIDGILLRLLKRAQADLIDCQRERIATLEQLVDHLSTKGESNG